MNESQIIEAALQRRFARAVVPECPNGPWRPASPIPSRPRSRGLAYACALLLVFVSAGVAGQASGVQPWFARFFQGSQKPLPPLIHRADRLTIAQAQQNMPFTIVVPNGLPPHTTFEYAHGVSEHSVPHVALYYQTQIGGEYYRIIISEATAVSGPALAHFDVAFKGKDGLMHDRTWTLPLRRWKHGNVIMEMLPDGLPPSVVDRIVRENTR
jgi:hypothetical protein